MIVVIFTTVLVYFLTLIVDSLVAIVSCVHLSFSVPEGVFFCPSAWSVQAIICKYAHYHVFCTLFLKRALSFGNARYLFVLLPNNTS